MLDSGRLTMGEKVAQFEREFAAYVGAKYAIMVNSGSSANLLMVDAMLQRLRASAPWKQGDEVIVPALAWPTTVWPLAQLGLVPVFVDVDPDTLAIDLKSAESVLGPKTRGMFLIHVLGQAAPASYYTDFCNRHGLTLLEDCCESLGARASITLSGGDFPTAHVGNFGVAGSFSFYYSHHLSTIEGGMIVTSDDALADDFRSLRAHGWTRDRSDRASWSVSMSAGFDERFLFIMPGYNVRPTEIQGAIGSVQLRRLPEMLLARDQVACGVYEQVMRIPWLKLVGAEHLIHDPASTTRSHSWMTLPLIVDDGAPLSRNEVVARLSKCGVDTRPIIAGNLVRHPATWSTRFKRAASLVVADRVFERGFMIGCHPNVSPESLILLERAFTSLGKL